MAKCYDVCALGELLIDFTPAGVSPAGMALYERNPGGAPANVLCALSRLGLSTAFIGKVGADAHGDFLRAVLAENGVDTRGLLSDAAVFTTLAFVDLSPAGEREFSFARKPGADTRLSPEELRAELLEQCRIFHFGSLSLTDNPARTATLEAIRRAKKAGALISYDPNYRAPLWSSEAHAVEVMRAALPLADVVKLSDEETALLTGAKEPEEAARRLCENGARCAVITLGKDGALARNKQGAVRRAPPSAPVADTTGAGDAFWGGFLYSLLRSSGAPEELSTEELERAVEFANAVATFCVQRRGAIPAMPTLAELNAQFPS